MDMDGWLRLALWGSWLLLGYLIWLVMRSQGLL